MRPSGLGFLQAFGAGLFAGPATSFFRSAAGIGFAASKPTVASDFFISPELFQKLLNDMKAPHENIIVDN